MRGNIPQNVPEDSSNVWNVPKVQIIEMGKRRSKRLTREHAAAVNEDRHIRKRKQATKRKLGRKNKKKEKQIMEQYVNLGLQKRTSN